MEWIKCEDKLPSYNGKEALYVLVVNKCFGIEVRAYNEHHKCWDDLDGDDYYCDAVGGNITHWMELPEGPKKG